MVSHPAFELFDGLPLHGKLDVGVNGVDSRTLGMTHQRHADFLQDAGLHQSRIKGVAEIVETNVADFGVFQCRLPRALHDADRSAVEVDHEAFSLAALKQMLVQPFG